MRIALRGGNFTFDEVLLDEWGSVKMATGVCDCNYRRTTVRVRACYGYGCRRTYGRRFYLFLWDVPYTVFAQVSVDYSWANNAAETRRVAVAKSLPGSINIKVSTISHQRAILHHLTHLSWMTVPQFQRERSEQCSSHSQMAFCRTPNVQLNVSFWKQTGFDVLPFASYQR